MVGHQEVAVVISHGCSWGMVMNNRRIYFIAVFAWRIVLACVFACAFARVPRAQQAGVVAPQFEAAGAFSYVRGNADDSGGGFNLDGGSGSFAHNYRGRSVLVADAGAYRFTGLRDGLSSTMYTYMG
jgi:hypothetical protein